MSKWIIVATLLYQTGEIRDHPAVGPFDDVATCLEYRTEMLVAYDRLVARTDAMAWSPETCPLFSDTGESRTNCVERRTRELRPWIFLGNPKCTEVPTQ